MTGRGAARSLLRFSWKAEVFMGMRKIESEPEARRCLASVQSSGTSLKEWARAHGIDGRSLQRAIASATSCPCVESRCSADGWPASCSSPRRARSPRTRGPRPLPRVRLRRSRGPPARQDPMIGRKRRGAIRSGGFAALCGQFVPNSPAIVQPHPLGPGGGLDLTNPRRVPADCILCVRPVRTP